MMRREALRLTHPLRPGWRRRFDELRHTNPTDPPAASGKEVSVGRPPDRVWLLPDKGTSVR